MESIATYLDKHDEIHKLPIEILSLILSLIDEISSTCFGLTCKRFYGIHKLVYPEPLLLRTPHFCSEASEYWTLYELLDTWKGPGLVFATVVERITLPEGKDKLLRAVRSREKYLDVLEEYTKVDARRATSMRCSRQRMIMRNREAGARFREAIEAKKEIKVKVASWRFVTMERWGEMKKTYWDY